MNWTCQQFEERLTDYLEDALSVADRAAFTAHQQECARCKPLVERVNAMVLAIHQIEPVEPPPRLIHNILDASGPKRERGWLGFGWLTPRFAMGTLTMALFLLIVYPMTGIEVSKLEWSDLRPTNMYRAADRRATLMYARGVKFVNGLRVIHEIQSRLQPSEPQAVPVKEELKKQTTEENEKPEKGKGREQNHAFDPGHLQTMVASVIVGAPGGIAR